MSSTDYGLVKITVRKYPKGTRAKWEDLPEDSVMYPVKYHKSLISESASDIDIDEHGNNIEFDADCYTFDFEPISSGIKNDKPTPFEYIATEYDNYSIFDRVEESIVQLAERITQEQIVNDSYAFSVVDYNNGAWQCDLLTIWCYEDGTNDYTGEYEEDFWFIGLANESLMINAALDFLKVKNV